MMDSVATEGKYTVLLVEDDPDDARMVFLGLQGEPVHLIHVRDGASALQAMEDEDVHTILVDHRLPDMTGVALIGRVRAAGFEGPVLMVSGVREDRIVASAFEAGADDFVVKDLDFTDELPGRLSALQEA